jgi:hypothetical protein
VDLACSIQDGGAPPQHRAFPVHLSFRAPWCRREPPLRGRRPRGRNRRGPRRWWRCSGRHEIEGQSAAGALLLRFLPFMRKPAAEPASPPCPCAWTGWRAFFPSAAIFSVGRPPPGTRDRGWQACQSWPKSQHPALTHLKAATMFGPCSVATGNPGFPYAGPFPATHAAHPLHIWPASLRQYSKPCRGAPDIY